MYLISYNAIDLYHVYVYNQIKEMYIIFKNNKKCLVYIHFSIVIVRKKNMINNDRAWFL